MEQGVALLNPPSAVPLHDPPPPGPPHRCGDVLEAHDLVLWLGDLNYRINGNSKAVRHLMRSRLHEVLHANDQLRLQQKSGAVFQVTTGGEGEGLQPGTTKTRPEGVGVVSVVRAAQELIPTLWQCVLCSCSHSSEKR